MKVPIPFAVDGPGPGWSEGLSGTSLARFREALLAWHRPRSRPLRIRASRDPWAILVAEVMAQQTQIARVDDAWVTWMERFPTPADLAAASVAEVLRAWSGLGYNRRAVSLQRAAVIVERDHGGCVPDDLDALLALPGIGPYTARAVLAVAFGRPVAPIDTNVGRVVGRLMGGAASAAELQGVADALVPADDPAVWTHATMDLGAAVCRSRRPRCDVCPVSAWCRSAGRVELATVSARRIEDVPFERTSRWLRGRIVARLRHIETGAWTVLPPVMGSHGAADIAAAVDGLRRDGLIELGPGGSVRLPVSRP